MHRPLRALLIDDRPDDVAPVLDELSRFGYTVTHERVDTPVALADALLRGRWDVILAEPSVPELSLDMVTRAVLEKALDVPCVAVARHGGEEAALLAMRAGARDFVTRDNLGRLATVVDREHRAAVARAEAAREPGLDALAERTAQMRTLAPIRRGKILIVDDEPMIIRVVKRMLATDHDVVTMGSASEALALIRAGQRFDAIVCDLMMPEMTGMDLHRELSQLHPDQAARMIFATGGAFTEGSQTFLEGAGAPWLEKPFDVGKLRALISERVG